jgi:LETM1 and EF-hand domain-containing protein 1, mitochondrial
LQSSNPLFSRGGKDVAYMQGYARGFIFGAQRCFSTSSETRAASQNEQRKERDDDDGDDDGDDDEEKKEVVKKEALVTRIWAKVKHEVHHYWTGAKLLGANVGLCTDLIKKLLHGKSLTRREKRLLRLTTFDVLRVFPLIIFFVVPALELALPFFLKFFPQMLPSTFESSLQREENMKRRLKVKLEVAKFLQESVNSQLARKVSDASPEQAQKLADILAGVRAGDVIPAEDVLHLASAFRDEYTLDSLERDQLRAVCRFLSLQPLGTTGFLRYKIAARLRELGDDDKLIDREGVDELTIEELQAACQARGMRSVNLSESVLRRQLAQWLDLSLRENVPASIMILSRALSFTADPASQPIATKSSTVETLLALLKDMPAEVIEDAELEIVSQTDAGSEAKLAFLRRVREEYQSTDKSPHEAAATVARDMADEDRERILEDFTTMFATMASRSAVDLERAELEELRTEHDHAKQVLESGTEKIEPALDADVGGADASASAKAKPATPSLVDEAAAASIAAAANVDISRQLDAEMAAVVVAAKAKRAVAGMDDDLQSGTFDAAAEAAGPTPTTPTPQIPDLVAARISSRIGGLLADLDSQLRSIDSDIGESMHLLDRDGDGFISPEEVDFAIRRLKNRLSDEQFRDIFDRLDVDHDGLLKVVEMRRIAEGDTIDPPPSTSSSPSSSSSSAADSSSKKSNK